MTAIKDVEYCLIADIGGTRSRFAVVNPAGEIVHVSSEENIRYDGLRQAVGRYIDGLPDSLSPDAAVFAVASPVRGDRVVLTNHDWSFSIEDFRKRFAFKFLDVLNDFAAIALAVPALEGQDVIRIGTGEPVRDRPVGIIGPGTGLGVSLLVPHEGRWLAVSTEGGHVTLAGCNEDEDRIIAFLRRELGHVSAERLLSGPGLTLLYDTLLRLQDREPVGLSPATITARDETGDDEIAKRTLDLFMTMLGTVAANLALTAGTRGGVYIAGGILPRLRERFIGSGFRDRFVDKGRYRDYLERIPTCLIVKENIALGGLRNYVDDRLRYR